ncbi:hypothetical protein JCM11251_000017 [Rhodosporidiobolus azoricus]
MLLPLSLLPLLASTASALQIPLARNPSSPSTFQQPDSSPPTDWPYRPLPWGEVNVLSTTDTHGWLGGHQRNEPSFSGDWGDLYSFVQRMEEEARRRGVDLLLVDSGDRVDGNGLVDAEPSPHPKGYTALSIFSQMPFDVVTTGNHELYKDPVAHYVSDVLGAKYGDRWVVSNVNLTSTDPKTGQVTEKLMGNRFRKFRTEQGRRVTAFGPLFDFKAHGSTVKVLKPSLIAQQPWFLSAISSAPDFFLFAGHMSLRIEPDSEWSVLVRAIRQLHPTVPVLIFGGHHHIRDCVQEDPYSMSLAAGRYMETVGFMSVSGLGDASQPPTFKRRYLDQNRNTYAYHTSPDFDTPEGKNITRWLSQTAERFNLTDKFGVAPQDYFLHRYPPTTNHSIFHLLTTRVLPLIVHRPDRPTPTPFTILNTGSIRFDVFKGDFTRNDQWIILPFANNFLYVPSVPLRLARKMLHYLNLVGEHGLLPSQSSDLAATYSSLGSSTSERQGEGRKDLFSPDTLPAASSAALEHAHRAALYASPSSTSSSSSSLDELNNSETGGNPHWRFPRRPRRATEGYVTLDSCGGSKREEQLGDDTAHKPFRSARQPVFVGTALPAVVAVAEGNGEQEGEEEGTIDVVFFDFITPDVLGALNFLGGGGGANGGKRYGLEDVQKYLEVVTANTLMETYARREWN